MAIRCRFVDSIASSPTVRLDLNDTTGAGFWLGDGGLLCPPPPLVQSASGAIPGMQDGGPVSASSYDNRTLTLPLTITGATSMDARNTLVSSLVKELNRETNILEYRPDGSSTSVFFRTFRSPQFEQPLWFAKQPDATVQLDLYAEPFAYGLRVDSTPVTVSSNPTTTNGIHVDVTVTGDVDTPAYVALTGGTASGAPTPTYLAVRSRGTPASLTVLYEAEAAAIMDSDTNLAGATDANATGAGINTVVTDFSIDPSMRSKLRFTPGSLAEIRGTYRVLVRVKKSVSGDVIKMQIDSGSTTATVGAGTTFQYADLGLIQFPRSQDSATGYGGTYPSVSSAETFQVQAGRTSGTGTLTFDHLLLIPADTGLNIITSPTGMVRRATTIPWSGTNQLIVDGPNDTLYVLTSGGAIQSPGLRDTGGTIPLQPGSNRLYVVENTGSSNTAVTSSVTVSWWPRYLTV